MTKDPHEEVFSGERQFTPRGAMMRAWMLWFVLVGIAAASTGVALLTGGPGGGQTEPRPATSLGLIVSMFVFALVIPIAFVWHRRCFRVHWKDGVVQPRGYVLAEMGLWGGITLAVVIVSVSSMIQRVFMPDMLLAFGGMLLLLLTWPNGWAMVRRRPRGEEDDEEALHLPEGSGDHIES